VLKQRAYFMTMIDGVFCVGRACDKQTRATFHSSRVTWVRLWAVITLQTVWWEIGGKSRSWNKNKFRTAVDCSCAKPQSTQINDKRSFLV